MRNISKLHWEVLDDPQEKALQSLEKFSDRGILGGGTALALQLGHRKSVDLDVFVAKPISFQFLAKVKEYYKSLRLLIHTGDELTFISPYEVKISFIFYPYASLYTSVSTPSIKFFHWRDIALDKAHTIGRRNEWRDYVDLYFCIKNSFSLKEIMEGAQKKFGDSFSEKLFLSQLLYIQDIADFTIELFDKSLTSEKVQLFFEEKIREIRFK